MNKVVAILKRERAALVDTMKVRAMEFDRSAPIFAQLENEIENIDCILADMEGEEPERDPNDGDREFDDFPPRQIGFRECC